MKLLDILSTSPHYFCRKWIGATNENSHFDLKGLKVVGLTATQPTHTLIEDLVDNLHEAYNHEQKSASVVLILNHTCPITLPSPPQNIGPMSAQ